jgi:hypothetical protein
VPRDRIQDRDAYTFFTGIDAVGQARWDADIDRRQPHFTDPLGVESINVVYDKALNRYILTCHRGDQGTLGIFDGPEPWGPWTTVAYYDNWLGLKGTGKSRDMLYISIPAKWINSDGLTLWFIYTGGLDSFNMVKGTLKLKEKAPPQSSTAIPDWADFPDQDRLTPHKVVTVGHNAEVRFLDLQNMTAGFPVSNGWFWRTRDFTDMIGPKIRMPRVRWQ